MTPSDPSPERRDRMKQILADSYPRVEKVDREPLPKSVLAELEGGRRSEAAAPERSTSFFKRLIPLIRGPQAMGLAAAAVLVLVAVIALDPFGKDDGGQMRSPGGPEPGVPVLVLHELSVAQLGEIRASSYFRPKQRVEVPAGESLDSVIKANERTKLIVVDGAAGTISMPFAKEPAPAPIEFSKETTDLPSILMDLITKRASETNQE